LCVLTQ
jgi:hypothetical protein